MVTLINYGSFTLVFGYLLSRIVKRLSDEGLTQIQSGCFRLEAWICFFGVTICGAEFVSRLGQALSRL
jgi:hypothetical protein